MKRSGARDESVLVVDDKPANIDFLREILAPHYSVRAALGGSIALRLLASTRLPDLILMDVHMLGMDGFEVCERLKADPRTRDIPVVFVTTQAGEPEEARGLEVGAVDYISKPFHPAVVIARVRTHLELRSSRRALLRRNLQLKDLVQRRTAALQSAFDELWQGSLDTVVRLARTAEFRDDDTGAHVLRMSHYAAVTARKLGLGEALCEQILHAAPLHDIGKIGIPDQVLLKPGRLSDEEWWMMRQHPIIGARILEDSSSPLVQLAESIARSHHERWDGRGYPNGLAKDAIPLPGRITAVADVFDALTSERPYKKALPVQRAVRILTEGAGSHFDPQVVDAFLSTLDEIVELRARYQQDRGDSLLSPLA